MLNVGKISTINHVSRYVIVKDIDDGHLKWSISEVAKLASISRSWIYKYLGRSKSEILKAATINLLDDFFCLSEERLFIEKELGSVEVFSQSRKLIIDTPQITSFYLLHYNDQNELGELIRKRDNYYMYKHLPKKFSTGSNQQVQLLRCIQHGAANAVFLNDEQAKKIFSIISSKKFLNFIKEL